MLRTFTIPGDASCNGDPFDIEGWRDATGISVDLPVGSPLIERGTQWPVTLPHGLATSIQATATAIADPISDTADQVVMGPAARTAFGVDGTGIKIGIISDSFAQLSSGAPAAADEQDGALPPAANVHVIQDGNSASGTDDEGRAIAEIIHTIAPGAQIYFYTGGADDAAEATATAALQAQGCQIILDDIGSFDEPFYQSGDVVENAMDAAVAAGVTYFTAAGNDGASFYEHAFTPITAQLPIGPSHALRTVTAYNFGTAANPSPYESLSIPGGSDVNIVLQWNQPFASIGNGAGATSSLSFYLFKESGGTMTLVSSGTENDIGQDPIQFDSFSTRSDATYELAIVLTAGAAPGLFKIIATNNGDPAVTFNDPNAGIGSGTVIGHTMDPNAITVGAVDEANPGVAEPSSETGPGEFLFDANGNPLPAPEVLNKVNITAPDGNQTDVTDINPFFGTSAAVGAAAAVGALVLQANPALSPADVANLLQDSATNLGNAIQNGAGLVNADGAVGLATSLIFSTGATGSDVLGTHLNDVFIATAGNHTIDGEGGIDTLVFAAALNQFVIADHQTSATVTTGSGIDSLIDVGRIQFSDGLLVISGTDPAAEVYRLYNTAFSRNADPTGEKYWTDILTAGTETLAQVANDFTTSTEFTRRYGALSNDAFVTLLYGNVLHRAPDPTGLNYWDGYLAAGHSRGEVVAGFSESTENIALVAPHISDGIWIT